MAFLEDRTAGSRNENSPLQSKCLTWLSNSKVVPRSITCGRLVALALAGVFVEIDRAVVIKKVFRWTERNHSSAGTKLCQNANWSLPRQWPEWLCSRHPLLHSFPPVSDLNRDRGLLPILVIPAAHKFPYRQSRRRAVGLLYGPCFGRCRPLAPQPRFLWISPGQQQGSPAGKRSPVPPPELAADRTGLVGGRQPKIPVQSTFPLARSGWPD